MANLPEYLAASGITQREFAARAGLSTSYMNEIVRGAKAPSLSAAFRIQKASKGAVDLSSLCRSPENENQHGAAARSVQERSAS